MTPIAPGPTSSNRPEPFVSGELLGRDLQRSNAGVSEADIAAVVRGDIAFGLDLLRVTVADDNLMVSPYSIATALSMLYLGARANTATEIAQVLHVDVDDSTLHGVRNFIDSALGAPPAPQPEDDHRAPFTIRPATSAWGQGGYPFLEVYLAVLATSYGAGVRLVDFAAAPEAATDTINDWVEDATEARIRGLIPQGAIDGLTRLVLVNAIWFKANWARTFSPELTSQGRFTLHNGAEVTVPLMHSNIRTGYTTNDVFEALRLPYAGDAAMVIALPRRGSPADLAQRLDPADLGIAWSDFLVEVTLPSFEFEAEVGLKEALQVLGMGTAFVRPVTGADDGADLTGITDVRELYVSDAFHKTFITLDENGTEAAAATALMIKRVSKPQAATFTADRPFLFWIEHAPTGELLFLGQLTDPTTGDSAT